MRIGKRPTLNLTALTTTLCIAKMFTFAVVAHAAPVSGTMSFRLQFGAGVLDGANNAEVCEAFASCRNGQESSLPGGFFFPQSVAVAPSGDVYVADKKNNRIQEFTPSGQFVLMFGWNVNKTKVNESAPQPQRNVCTATEVSAGAECQAGEEGTGQSGQLSNAQAIAVDPMDGHVYVYENASNFRVEEFTETGQFVLMVGREVNETLSNKSGTDEDEKNVCTAVQVETEGMKCRAGKRTVEESTEHDAFKPAQAYGNLLAVGGPKKLLYFGDESRIQMIDPATGKWEGELRLGPNDSPAFPAAGVVTALAVDNAGDMYVTEAKESAAGNDASPPGVYEFSQGGSKIGEVDMSSANVEAIALDPFGRMAVTESIVINQFGGERSWHGALFDLASDEELSQFAPPDEMGYQDRDLAFNASGELYSADPFHHDVELYRPVTVATLKTVACKNRTSSEVTFAGTVGPENVGSTVAWFEYGPSMAFGSATTKQSFATSTSTDPVEATVTGLVPNTIYYDRLIGEDENRHAPEQPFGLHTLSCKTRALAPAIPGAPAAFPSGATFTAAALKAQIDPENVPTSYRFQYAPYDASSCPNLDACAAREETSALKSSENTLLTASQEVKDLQPNRTYLYRLVGDNAFSYQGEPEGGETHGQEGTFVTIAAPAVSASTLKASGVGTTSATIAGLVNPDGFEATYSFEVGIYEGAATRYGIVLSAPTGSNAGPVEERLGLSGLQPGTTYAYRIVVHSGYGTAYGANETFTTGGLPDVLVQPPVLAQLAVPAIAFPTEQSKITHRAVRCRRGYRRTRKNTCVKTKRRRRRAKSKKANRARRAGMDQRRKL